ncbi:MAG: hypothetical protein CMH44_15950 [Muricauda sp.]|nr:hypothetical protein [Allomuricauda sp.]
MYYLGIDLGSSSIKIALVEQSSGKKVAIGQEPENEMSMQAAKLGWAEQEPELWWRLVCQGIQRISKENNVSSDKILGIGIAYQMHGLVVVGADGKPLRNSIIWCDSRAVGIGDKAYAELGEENCDSMLLNSPGNFTASKLAWVRENEPDVFAKVHKFMLPGCNPPFSRTIG